MELGQLAEDSVASHPDKAQAQIKQEELLQVKVLSELTKEVQHLLLEV